jgi:hypothetical protein
LLVTTVTTGDTLDLDGYAFMLDDTVSEALGINDSLTFVDLAPGDHTVELHVVQVNCTLRDDLRQIVSVTAGDTARAVFEVTCAAALFDRIAFSSSRDGESTFRATRQRPLRIIRPGHPTPRRSRSRAAGTST